MKIIYELINKGKGKYGDSYVQITTENLLKIYDEREDSSSGGGTNGNITTNGHVILDGNGSIMTQQPNLRFNRMIVTNDNVNSQTIVTRPPSLILSSTPPINPLQGDEWINNITWKTYVYYDSYWVEEGISTDSSASTIYPPILNSYSNESGMIGDQPNQIKNYIYYDGNSYWEYLGTTNLNINDYRKIGGGSGNYVTIGDLENYVPYIGAIDDVDLGEQGITTEWVKLNITPVIPTDQGSVYWDEDDNVLAVVLNGAIQKVGEVTFYNVKNQTGSTIPKGTGVGFAGVVGSSARIKVAPYLADGSQPSIYYVGITAEEILDGEDGKVYNFGPIRGLNTSAFNEGDVLYASSTVAGGFTTTPPTAPNNVIVVAAVLTDSATVGALLVRVTVADLGGGSAGGRDDDAVHYDAADSKNGTERNQARVNIGSTSATPQVIATAGAINDLTITSNSLVFTGASVVLSGIVAGLDGEEITILNTNATALSILSQSTLSTANNRIIGAVLVPQFSIVRLKYRTTTNRWTLENVGINDGRYLRKDIADSRTGTLTQNGPMFINIGINQRLEIRRSGTGSFNEVFSIYEDQISTTIPRIRVSSQGALFLNSATASQTAQSIIQNVKSQGATRTTRRDELPLNYPETVTTSGTINNLDLANEGVKLLILTLADDLTGVVPVTTNTGRLLRIEGRNAGGVIIRHDSASSTAANRFSIGSDLTISNGEIYTFIYTNARWRRVL
jgi:hypothetical protein